MKPNESVGVGGQTADPNNEPMYYVPSPPNDGGPVLLWHESLLERRAWEIVRTQAGDLLWEVPRERNHRIKAAFDIAARFEKEAAKRRTGGA